jgi:hypothetical protein
VKTRAKPKKLNHTFEKEMMLATTYRDAFLERKLAVKKKVSAYDNIIVHPIFEKNIPYIHT